MIGTLRCLRHQQEPRQICWRNLEGIGSKGCLEGSRRPYHYDRYIDCPPMVHLRWCQGCPPFATSTTTTDARITQKEARSTKAIGTFLLTYLNSICHVHHHHRCQ